MLVNGNEIKWYIGCIWVFNNQLLISFVYSSDFKCQYTSVLINWMNNIPKEPLVILSQLYYVESVKIAWKLFRSSFIIVSRVSYWLFFIIVSQMPQHKVKLKRTTYIIETFFKKSACIDICKIVSIKIKPPPLINWGFYSSV